jgi:7-keto-8-aminopelargonate synthetase-like enzyme
MDQSVIYPHFHFFSNSGLNIPADVYREADKAGVVVVGGFQKSVGASGGYVLGGGHSVLSPRHGLAVDSTLFLSTDLAATR